MNADFRQVEDGDTPAMPIDHIGPSISQLQSNAPNVEFGYVARFCRDVITINKQDGQSGERLKHLVAYADVFYTLRHFDVMQICVGRKREKTATFESHHRLDVWRLWDSLPGMHHALRMSHKHCIARLFKQGADGIFIDIKVERCGIGRDLTEKLVETLSIAWKLYVLKVGRIATYAPFRKPTFCTGKYVFFISD